METVFSREDEGILSMWIDTLNHILWSPVMLAVFLGTGLYFTLRSRFFQLHPAVLRDTFGASGLRSSLRTLSAALGACMGTGNIAGVGTALVTGGPGALFWMCVSAFLGMMTSFAETVLAVKFREPHKDGWQGGAMQVLSRGLGMKKTAMVYAFLLTASSFGIGNMAQSGAAAEALHSALGVPAVAVGAVFSVLIGVTVFGGIHRITAVTEKAVPLLSGLFFLCALGALWTHRAAIPEAVCGMMKAAFSPAAVFGGTAGFSVRTAMRVGVTRGVFSNEAGLGSTAVIHASATTDSPVRQGLWGVVEVFLDTVFMCTVTGLVILTSGVPFSGDGASLYGEALCVTFGKGGSILTALTLALLGFASMTGWAYCGERGVAFLFGEGGLPVYRVLYAVVAFLGSFLHMDTIFALSDALNCLMAVPNLLSLWLLSGTVIRELRMYKQNRICQHYP